MTLQHPYDALQFTIIAILTTVNTIVSVELANHIWFAPIAAVIFVS